MSEITTRDFIKLIYDRDVDDEFIETLREKGIIRLEDVCCMDEGIERKSAARITHQYMCVELEEPDLPDISAAGVLRDLYDCRVCVNHIAQMYLKGIMEAVLIPGLSDKEFWIFDSKAKLSLGDALKIKEKIKGDTNGRN